MRVLAVDPGREKCGVAVCGPEGIVARRVVPLGDLAGLVGQWVALHGVGTVLIGNQTGFTNVSPLLGSLPVPIVPVEERGTTLLARLRYFQDHPPRGWKRFLPRSLQVPSEPYDDYAAVVLAEAYLDAPNSRPGGKDTNI